jgi:hypothetical protein
MGFRDLELFNQAMLGRQCWCLLTDPSSLCARVLKGRYFPNYDFWSAFCPCSASYTWRSILHGRDLVRKGALWRIGNGLSINIMKDYWIPGTIPCALSSLTPIPDDLKVASMFAADGYSWDVDRVRT